MALTKDGVDLDVCAYCNTTLDDMSRTVDHLYPKSKGGILSNKNKVPACGNCNRLKADMDVKEFHKALTSMMFLESTNHKKMYSYLKKVKANAGRIIDNLENDRKHNLRHDPARGR